MKPILDKERSPTFLINDVSRLLKRRFEDEARRFGVTLPQWRTLVEIYRGPGITQVALAAAVDSDPMTLSGILDRLEKRGLVDRVADPHDSRAKLARLTPEGEALVERARQVGSALQESALSGLDPAAREALIETLRTIRCNITNMTDDEKETA